MTGWKLRRLNQCAKCPWKVGVDPHDIPDGYSVDAHRALSRTIAEPGSLARTQAAMQCHEHGPDDPAHCVGWLHNQIGHGNNIRLRLSVMSCKNIRGMKVTGQQHERFEDTLP